MNAQKLYLPLLIITFILSITSCKKKCIVEDDTDSGSIIADVVIYPSSGYMTSNMGGNYVITASHPYANNFEISINGSSKTPINYSNYTLLCYPTTANCSASYDRTVTIDDTAQTVVYKILVTQCTDCKEKRTVENYVLVPKFPASYTVYNDVSYVDK